MGRAGQWVANWVKDICTDVTIGNWWTRQSSSANLAPAQSELVIGDGQYKYRVRHHWAQLPDKYTWQTTHNVAVDKAGNLYVIHEGRENLKDHPSIFLFDGQGKVVRAFGSEFKVGGSGNEVLPVQHWQSASY